VNWSSPRIATRTGAAHIRHGKSCQDASGWIRINGGGGGADHEVVFAMVVADGHGGSRYRRSRDGSRIACEVALELVAEWFARGSASNRSQVRDPGALHWLLQEDLAEAIVGRWQEQIQRHWREYPDAAGEPFTPLLYGTTLGLVLLAPRWWAHTGLGDWDLVRMDAVGEAQLVSQEGEVGGGGEATTSLCLADAALRFADRTGVHALEPGEPPFSLLLSTDGIRKSCSTDADFFTLARYLLESARGNNAPESPEANPQEQLNADLDRISSEGSGDDVSVAIVFLETGIGGGERRTRHQKGRRWERRVEQPDAIGEDQFVLVEPSSGPAARERISSRPSQSQRSGMIGIGITAFIGIPLFLLLLWMASNRFLPQRQAMPSGLEVDQTLSLGHPSRAVLSNSQREILAVQARHLCNDVALLQDNIKIYGNPVFEDLRRTSAMQARDRQYEWLQVSVEKRYGNNLIMAVRALVAWSFDPKTKGYAEGAMNRPDGVQSCPQLQNALRDAWRQQQRQPLSPPGQDAGRPSQFPSPQPGIGGEAQR
jgi:serine/threonine protein phosphatase PrpC